jgi:hypothetical protein
MAFTAMYVARTYKNGLHRPNAFIDRGRSVLQPARFESAVDAEKSGSQQPWRIAVR